VKRGGSGIARAVFEHGPRFAQRAAPRDRGIGRGFPRRSHRADAAVRGGLEVAGNVVVRERYQRRREYIEDQYDLQPQAEPGSAREPPGV